MIYDYLYRTQTKPTKNEFMKKWNLIFDDARNYFSMNLNLVGSSKRNLTLARLNDKNHEPLENYDFDYQVVISQIKDNVKFNSARKIKDYFIVQFQNRFSDWTIQNSTTAITLINENEWYSFDIVICSKLKEEPFKVIKRATPNQGQDKYIWQEVTEYKNHKENLCLIKGPEKWKKVRELYKVKKIDYMNNPDQKSYLIFIEAIKDSVDFFNS